MALEEDIKDKQEKIKKIGEEWMNREKFIEFLYGIYNILPKKIAKKKPENLLIFLSLLEENGLLESKKDPEEYRFTEKGAGTFCAFLEVEKLKLDFEESKKKIKREHGRKGYLA